MAIHLSLMCTVIHLKLNTAGAFYIGHVQLTHEESTSEEFEVYVGGDGGGGRLLHQDRFQWKTLSYFVRVATLKKKKKTQAKTQDRKLPRQEYK